MNEKIKEFRQEIAKLEKEQKELKPQRKTVNGRPENATINPYVAAENVRHNKETLRAMYAAYGLMRGKPFEVTESAAKPIMGDDDRFAYVPLELRGKHPLCLYLSEINGYLEKYGYSLPYEEKENFWGQKIKKFDYEHIEAIIRPCEQTA